MINQRKLTPKVTNQGRFTIACSIGLITIDHALCDLGESINLMSLSMMRKLNDGELMPTPMTLTLVGPYITYSYRVLEDVLLRVKDLIFSDDFG